MPAENQTEPKAQLTDIRFIIAAALGLIGIFLIICSFIFNGADEMARPVDSTPTCGRGWGCPPSPSSWGCGGGLVPRQLIGCPTTSAVHDCPPHHAMFAL